MRFLSAQVGVRLALILAMVVSLVPYISHAAVHHGLDAMALSRDWVAEDHGRSHGVDEEEADSDGGQRQIHDTGDPVHEAMGPAVVLDDICRRLTGRWLSSGPPRAPEAVPPLLDRPPRRGVAA